MMPIHQIPLGGGLNGLDFQLKAKFLFSLAILHSACELHDCGFQSRSPQFYFNCKDYSRLDHSIKSWRLIGILVVFLKTFFFQEYWKLPFSLPSPSRLPTLIKSEFHLSSSCLGLHTISQISAKLSKQIFKPAWSMTEAVYSHCLFYSILSSKLIIQAHS